MAGFDYAGRSCPLSGGLLTGTMIMCQCHGSEFDVTTGAVVRGPAARPLGVYEVQVADGSIRIRA
jgi:nitrite reductase/ring-hydroxylating ferredoxin subunit